jgi:hypothetical protein
MLSILIPLLFLFTKQIIGKSILLLLLLFSVALQPSAVWLWSSRFLITHDAPQLVGLHLTSDQLVAETST